MSTAFKPSSRQRVIATALSRNAQLLGRASTLRRLDRQAGDHFDEPRIGHLIAHVAARQSELGRALADEFRAGRFSATSILLRSALETTAWIAWPLAGKTHAEQRQRLIRVLLQGYRDLRNKGATLPPDVDELFARTTGKAARKPPEIDAVLKELDEVEKSHGNEPFWVTHKDSYALASDYTHPTLRSSVLSLDRPEPNELLGVTSLIYGHQYVAIGGVYCALLANSLDIQTKLEHRYASVVTLQHNELERTVG